MASRREVLEAVDGFTQSLAASPRAEDRALADALGDRRAELDRAPMTAPVVTIELIRTISTAAVTEEWSEHTDLVGLRLGQDGLELWAVGNVATLVGASPSDEVRILASADARPPDGPIISDRSTGAPDGGLEPERGDENVAAWSTRAAALVADPRHRVLRNDTAARRDLSRRVVLRDEQDGADRRHLVARLDAAGDLHIDGQDLGPGTAGASGDGEYEWFQTVRAADLAELLAALGYGPRADVLDALEATFTGSGSYRLEAVLRSGVVPVERQVWSG